MAIYKEIRDIIVVSKRSLFERYSHSPDETTREYVLQNPSLKESDEIQKKSLESVLKILQKEEATAELLYREDLPKNRKRFEECDLVVTVGGDGTLLEAAHYIGDTPILGVNSDPQRSIGYFCAATIDSVEPYIKSAYKSATTKLHRLEVIQDDQSLSELVLNDIHICHSNPSEMIRYSMSIDGVDVERRNSSFLRSSGLLVCTAAGSTAWMYECGGKIMPLGSRRMQLHERDQREAKFHFAREKININSRTREGKIFIDGSHLHYDFTLGSKIVIQPGKPLIIVGDLRDKRKR